MADVTGACERYQETLVEHAAGRVGGDVRAALERHLEACAECRESLAVIRAVQRHPARVPADLQARVQAAVREASTGSPPPVAARQARRGPGRVRAGWWRPVVPLAAAAGLAAVVWFAADGGGVDVEAAALDGYTPYGELPASDGFVAGDVVLSELSVEELETLLEELEP